ncbi:hypothetical protein TWF730_002442 [Orbilia blumenaviensis]|uniref:Uncharacterized protein n=1 Tax=Orbilia blumenaviensis TaxID=1796055 RepID=A0AAV9UAS7_9PEZI
MGKKNKPKAKEVPKPKNDKAGKHGKGKGPREQAPNSSQFLRDLSPPVPPVSDVTEDTRQEGFEDGPLEDTETVPLEAPKYEPQEAVAGSLQGISEGEPPETIEATALEVTKPELPNLSNDTTPKSTENIPPTSTKVASSLPSTPLSPQTEPTAPATLSHLFQKWDKISTKLTTAIQNFDSPSTVEQVSACQKIVDTIEVDVLHLRKEIEEAAKTGKHDRNEILAIMTAMAEKTVEVKLFLQSRTTRNTCTSAGSDTIPSTDADIGIRLAAIRKENAAMREKLAALNGRIEIERAAIEKQKAKMGGLATPETVAGGEEKQDIEKFRISDFLATPGPAHFLYACHFALLPTFLSLSDGKPFWLRMCIWMLWALPNFLWDFTATIRVLTAAVVYFLICFYHFSNEYEEQEKV